MIVIRHQVRDAAERPVSEVLTLVECAPGTSFGEACQTANHVAALLEQLPSAKSGEHRPHVWVEFA